MTVVFDEKYQNIKPINHFSGTTPSHSQFGWVRINESKTQEAIDSLRKQFAEYLIQTDSIIYDPESLIDDLATIVINPEGENIPLASKNAVGKWIYSAKLYEAGINVFSRADDIIRYFQQLLENGELPVRAYTFSDFSNHVGFWAIHERDNIEVMYQLAEVHGALIDRFPAEEISFLMIGEDEFREMHLPANAMQIFDGGGHNANR